MLGDSKSAANAQNPWEPILYDNLMATGQWDRIVYNWDLAQSGQTVTGIKNLVDAWLASHTAIIPPQFALINLGANGWVKADMAYIMDALHAQWPATRVLLARVSSRGAANPFYDDTDIPDLISTRTTWAGLGPDERVFLQGVDNFTSETYDGQHYSLFGAQQAAAAWKVAMGF